ncbi:OmpA family protein [Alphaproteobacteria bacterium]|nr:OmpA family protein [Alphaproteobacteria bacterium]
MKTIRLYLMALLGLSVFFFQAETSAAQSFKQSDLDIISSLISLQQSSEELKARLEQESRQLQDISAQSQALFAEGGGPDGLTSKSAEALLYQSNASALKQATDELLASISGEQQLEPSIKRQLDMVIEQETVISGLLADNKSLRKAVYQRMAAPVRERQALRAQIKQIEQNNGSLDQRVKELRRQISELETEHAAVIQTLAAQHLREKGLLIQSHDDTLATLRSSHDSILTGLRTQIADLTDKLNSRNKKSHELNAEIRRLTIMGNKLFSDLEACSQLNEQLKGEIGTIKNQLGQKTSALEQKDQIVKDQQAEKVSFSNDLTLTTKAKDKALADLKVCLAVKSREPEMAFADQMNERLIEHLSSTAETATRKNRIVLPSDVLFASGKAELTSAGKAAVEEISTSIAAMLATVPDGKPLLLRVDGHTDNVPLKGRKWASNWELSSARANAVVLLLLENDDITPTRVLSAAFEEHAPMAPNDSRDNKTKNRRVEISFVAR